MDGTPWTARRTAAPADRGEGVYGYGWARGAIELGAINLRPEGFHDGVANGENGNDRLEAGGGWELVEPAGRSGNGEGGWSRQWRAWMRQWEGGGEVEEGG